MWVAVNFTSTELLFTSWIFFYELRADFTSKNLFYGQRNKKPYLTSNNIFHGSQ